MRPVIGLIPLYDDEKQSIWMVPGYMKVLEECGAIPLILPLSTDQEELEQAFSMLDGLLLTGGHDVDPRIYGASMSDKCGSPCKERDEMERYLFQRALAQNLPTLGICRGIQFMNAALGGDLYQDLPSEYECLVEHHMTPPYDRAAHKVTVLPNTPLAQIIGEGEIEVNSYHHQAVKTVAERVMVCATSEDGLVEGIAVRGQRFALGVQWHPEFWYQTNKENKKLMQAFVDACKAS